MCVLTHDGRERERACVARSAVCLMDGKRGCHVAPLDTHARPYTHTCTHLSHIPSTRHPSHQQHRPTTNNQASTMLARRDGSLASKKEKMPLLALMTPQLRSLFEGTVEPLLEALPAWGALKKGESNKRGCEEALALYSKELVKAQAALMQEEKGSEAHAKAEKEVKRIKKIAAETDALAKAIKAILSLRVAFAMASKPAAVKKALGEPEAPVARSKQQATAPSSPSSSAASPLTALMAIGPVATFLLGFLRGKHALRVLGTACSRLRANVKAMLSRLGAATPGPRPRRPTSAAWRSTPACASSCSALATARAQTPSSPKPWPWACPPAWRVSA